MLFLFYIIDTSNLINTVDTNKKIYSLMWADQSLFHKVHLINFLNINLSVIH